MNTIKWADKAVKQLQKIRDVQERQRIYQESRCLLHFPDCANVKKLTNHRHAYRLRIGRWRLFFDFDGEVRIISIEEVKKRDERTY